MSLPDVRIRSWVAAGAADRGTGMLGWLTLTYGDLVLDSVTLRITEAGRYALSFPCKTDKAGRRHAYYRPENDAARRRIEQAVFGELPGVVEEES